MNDLVELNDENLDSPEEMAEVGSPSFFDQATLTLHLQHHERLALKLCICRHGTELIKTEMVNLTRCLFPALKLQTLTVLLILLCAEFDGKRS